MEPTDEEIERLADAIVAVWWERCPLCDRQIPKGSLALHYRIACFPAEERRAVRWFFVKLGIVGALVAFVVGLGVWRLFW